MNDLTKIRLLETALMEVAPLGKVDFGYNQHAYQWDCGGVFPVDKKGGRVGQNQFIPSQLTEYEQRQLLDALKTKLQFLAHDYSDKAKTAERILKAVSDKDMDY